MATEIDKRVVEMQFDNKDFEKNCQKSLTTLEKLKMALNFDGAKGLDNMTKAANRVDLSNLTKSADAVRVKFSLMETVGMTVIQRLTNSLINFGTNIWNSTLGQISSGGMARTLKIEQARFQMKALAENMDEVKKGAIDVTKYMNLMHKAIDNAVTGTAYGYDAAAAVASQLMASNINDASTMEKHLRAIAGAASMAGASFEEIGHIFTTVASNGRVMGDQLMSFSVRGINLAAVLAKSLNKSEAEMKDYISKGKVSFQQFSDALYDAYGEAAGKADDTFNGVTSNIKAQLSRIGQLFSDPFVEHVIPFLKEVKARIKDINTVLKPVANTWGTFFKYVSGLATNFMKNLNVSKLRRFVNGIENILVALVEIFWTIGRAIKEVFPPSVLDEIHEGVSEFERFTDSLIPSKEALDSFKEIVKALLIPFKALWTIGSAVMRNAIYPMIKVFVRLISAVVRIGKALKPVIDALLQLVTNGEFISNVIMIIVSTLITLSNILITIVECVVELIDQLTRSGTFNNLMTFLSDVAKILSNVILNVLIFIFGIINNILSLLNSDNIHKFFSLIADTLAVITAGIVMIFETISKWFEDISKKDNILGDLINFFKEIGSLIANMFNGKDTSGNLKKIENLLISMKDRVKVLWEQFKEFLHGLDGGKVILYAFSIAMIMLILSIRNLIQAFANIANTVKEGMESIVDIFGDIRNVLKGMIKVSPALQLMIGFVAIIWSLALSLKLLAEVPYDDLKNAAIILGVFAGGLILLAVALSKLNISSNMNAIMIAPILLSLALSVTMIAAALRILAGLDTTLEDLVPSLVAIGVLLGLLTGAIIAINATAKLMFPEEQKMMMSAGAILAFAAAIGILVGCLYSIRDLDLEQAKTGLIAISGLLVALAGSVTIMGMVGFSFGGGMGAIAFVLSFVILLAAVKKISEFPFSSMIQGLKNTGAVMAALAALYLAFVGISLLAGGNVFIQNVTRMLTAFVAMIAIATLAIFAIGSMDQNMIAKGMAAITYISILFAAITKSLLKSFDKFSAGMKNYKDRNIMASFSRFLIAFSSCMILLAAAGHIANGISPRGLFNTIAIIVSLGAVVTALEYFSAHTKRANTAVIIAFMSGIVAILGMMIMMTYTDKDALWSVSAAVAVVLAGLALIGGMFVRASKEVNAATGGSANSSKKTTSLFVAFILGIVGVISSLAFLVKNSKGVSSETLSTVAGAVRGVLLSTIVLLGTAAYIANKTSDVDTKKLIALSGSLTLLGVVYAEIAAVAVAMTQYIKNVDSTIMAMSNMAIILVSFFTLQRIFGDMLENLDDDIESNDLLKVAASMVIISSVFAVIGGVITAMTTFLSGQEGAAVQNCVMVLSVFGVFMFAFSKLISTMKDQELESGDLMKVAASMVIISSVLLIIGGVITAMTLLTKDSGWSMLASVGAIILSFLTVIIVFKKLLNTMKDNDMDASELLKASSSIVIMSSVLLVIAGAITAMTLLIKGSEATMIASAIFILLSFIALIGAFDAFLNNTKNMRSSHMLKAASSIVIMSSVFLVIAGALTTMSVLLSDTNSIPSAIASFTLIMLSFAAVVGALYLMSKKVTDTKKLIAISGAIAIACSALLIIATSILMLDGVKVDETFVGKMSALIIPFGIIVGLLAIVASVGQGLNIASILAVSGAVVLGSTALLLIAASIVKIVEATRGLDESKLDNVMAIVKKFMLVLAVLAGIGVVAGAIGPVGLAIVGAIMAIMGVFVLFAAGVDILFNAVNKVVDCVTKLNSIDIDYDKIKENFMNSISGVTDAILESIPKILQLVGVLVMGILMVLNSGSLMAAAVAMSYVMSFLAGVAACLPAILYMCDIIMHEIVDWLEQPEQMDLIESFFEKIGEALTRIIIGAIKGVFGVLYDLGNEFGEYMQEKWLKPKGLGEAALDKNNKEIEDKNHEKLIKESQSTRVDNIMDYYTKQADFVSALQFADAASTKNVKAQVWRDLVKSFNDVAEAARNSGEELTDETIRRAKNALQYAPIEILKDLDSAYGLVEKDVDDFVETVEVANEKLESIPETGSEKFGTLTNDIEETTEAVNDFKEASENSTDGISEKTEEASISLEKFKEKFNTLGDGLKDALGSVDLKKFAGTLGVDAESLGSVLGKVTGISFGEDYEKTLDFYMEDAMRKIYDKNGQWQYKWQTFKNEQGERIYSSAEQYANAMMDKQSDNTSSALHKLADFLGINLDVNDALGEGTNLLGDFGSSMTNLGNETEKTKSKFQEFNDNLKESIKNSLNLFDELSEQEEISPEEMLDRMFGHISQVAEWAHNITVLAARGMSEGLLNELKELGPQGAAKVKAFVNMTDSQLREANLLYQDAAILPDAATNKIIKSYKDAGFNASMGFSNGIDQNAADEAMRNLGTNSLNALENELEINSPSKKTMKDGEYSTEGLAKGLVDAKSQSIIKNSTHILAGLLMNGLRSELKPEAFNKIGQQAMQGLGLGITNNIPAIIAKISSVASNIITTLANALKIKSPSKVMEELGEYTMLGFGNGMEEGGTSVEKITEQQANDILDAMKANIAAITNGWSEDNVYQPVIRPVFDMSAIGQGYSDIQTWFSNANGVDISGNLSRLTPTNKESTDVDTQLLNAIRDFNNDDVVSEISALRDDISQLQDAMTNLQVVMNTGALVGQIVEPMDIALGSRALRNRRGR